ncbi:MAG: chloride channel protein [Chthoniobacterales bacterium]
MNKYLHTLESRLAYNFRIVGVTLAIGLSSGLVAVAFRYTADYLTEHLIHSRAGLDWISFALWIFPTMVVGAWIAGLIMARFAPDAAGSGIPQVKLGYYEGKNTFSFNLIWVKFVSGVLAIGTGSSLGREGPTIHIGAALASWFARITKEPDAARANAICAGSAAGLAAAFHSPIAGVTLVLEEITNGKDEDKFSGRALCAAALAVTVIYFTLGHEAALPVNFMILPTSECFWLAIPVSLICGLLGISFQSLTLWIRGIAKKSSLPAGIRPAIGAAVAAVVGIFAYALTQNTGIFGLGEKQLFDVLINDVIWQAALVLAIAKLLATALCYGSGASGGIFAPILFFGAFCASGIVGGLQTVFDLSDAERTLLAITGISATLSAVVRAPITSIVIVLEMTRLIYATPLLMIAAVLGSFLNRIAFPESFYSAALRQDGTPVD